MYARVTTLSIKPENITDADALATEITPDVLAIPGIKHFFRGRDENGNSVVIAIYENSAAAAASTATVKGMFGKFTPYMSSPPVPTEYEIYNHGSNA